MTITFGVDNVCYTQSMKSGKMDLVGFLDRVAAHRAAAVQIDPLWPSQGLDLSEKSLEYLHQLLAERNLQIIVKGNSGGLGSLANAPAASRSDLEVFRSKILAAARLNSPIVRLVARSYPYPNPHFPPPSGVTRFETITWVIENLNHLIPLAADCGVRLVIENHGDLRLAEMDRILNEIGSPWLGIQFDVLEQVAIFEDPRQAASRLLPHALTIHWSDAYPELDSSGFRVIACEPGQGLIDLSGVFKIIAALKQDVFLFTAFQTDLDAREDLLVKSYLNDLHHRMMASHTVDNRSARL